MPTTSFNAFLPEIAPTVPGCANPTIINAVRNACIEFCTNTLYWQEVQDSVDLVAADFPYPLEAPNGAQAVQAVAVAVNGRPLGPAAQDELDNKVLNWRVATGDPRVFFQYNPNDMGVYPLPDDSKTFSFVMRVAYAPTRVATGIESFVYEKQLENIAAGALTRLCAIPGQSWSDPTLAAYYRGLFNNAMDTAMVEVQKSYTRASLQVQMRMG